MPVHPLAVHVRMIGVPGLPERLGGGVRVGRPEVGEDAPDRNATLVAVIRPLEIPVAFELAAEAQAYLPAQAYGAHLLSLPLSVGQAAVGDLAIDGKTAA